MVHLLNRVPEAIVEKGVPSSVDLYTEFVLSCAITPRFRSVYKEARVAAKVPEASGFAGQLLGRTVVALVGSEGLSENDPLVKLDRMNTLLLEWGREWWVRCRSNLEQAYEIGASLEGSAHDVLAQWLEDVKERIEFEKVLEQMRLHVRHNEYASLLTNTPLVRHRRRALQRLVNQLLYLLHLLRLLLVLTVTLSSHAYRNAVDDFRRLHQQHVQPVALLLLCHRAEVKRVHVVLVLLSRSGILL